MKGNNDLILNQATMIQALQFWLNSRFKKPMVKVTGVALERDGVSTVFRVTFEGDEEND